VRHKTVVILVVILVFLIYASSLVYNQYAGYANKYRPLIGGIQIEITKAEWYGPGASKGFCSLAFPVTFAENNGQTGRLGFITAGHCIETANGGDYVDQPTKGSWFWENYIGRGIRTSWPYGGGSSDLDAALIRLENLGLHAFIFENGIYRQFDMPDRNNRVGITEYLTPSNLMVGTIVYKSGRTTGLTYGQIIDINGEWRPPNTNIVIKPVIIITRCPKGQCFYNDRPISDRGDSGGVWYIRYPIYAYRFDLYRLEYGAKVIGIHNGGSNITAVASWATKISEKWSDLYISYVVCGSNRTSSCW
jgi:hypothetical protein